MDFDERQQLVNQKAREPRMTADYNGWNDAPEAEREAMDVFSGQECEAEALAQVEDLQKFARRLTGSRDGAGDPVSLRPAA